MSWRGCWYFCCLCVVDMTLRRFERIAVEVEYNLDHFEVRFLMSCSVLGLWNILNLKGNL
jgi:hypothetical protein